MFGQDETTLEEMEKYVPPEVRNLSYNHLIFLSFKLVQYTISKRLSENVNKTNYNFLTLPVQKPARKTNVHCLFFM